MSVAASGELAIGTTLDGGPFTLPAAILTHTVAILAKKGAGKTYLAGVLEEEFAKNGLPFVVLDPVGVHYGIRSNRDGRKSAYGVVVFGGRHADIPIERHGDLHLARHVVQWEEPACGDAGDHALCGERDAHLCPIGRIGPIGRIRQITTAPPCRSPGRRPSTWP